MTFRIDLRLMRNDIHDSRLAVKLINSNLDWFFFDEPITITQHQEFMERSITRGDKPFVIEKNGISCGTIGLYAIDKKSASTQWGHFTIDSQHQGIGTIAEYMLLDYIFLENKFDYTYCHTLATNQTMIHLQEGKFGFTREATLAKHVIKKGQHFDVFKFGLTSIKWTKQRQKFSGLTPFIGKVKT